MGITAIILAKNEEKNVERAIKSVLFCDEVIVIDDGSTDSTQSISQRFGAKVYPHESKSDFALQRNWAMSKAVNNWTLFIDADEEVTDELKKEIVVLLSNGTKAGAHYIKRRDYWWGRELGYGEVLKAAKKGIIRLVHKQSGRWKGKVHEEFVPESTASIKYLKGAIRHYPHPGIKEFIGDINRYSDLRARELKAAGVKSNIFAVAAYPAAKFILNYFVYLGFLDGPAGFAYAFLMSFHSYLVRAKLYQYWKIDNSA